MRFLFDVLAARVPYCFVFPWRRARGSDVDMRACVCGASYFCPQEQVVEVMESDGVRWDWHKAMAAMKLRHAGRKGKGKGKAIKSIPGKKGRPGARPTSPRRVVKGQGIK